MKKLLFQRTQLLEKTPLPPFPCPLTPFSTARSESFVFVFVGRNLPYLLLWFKSGWRVPRSHPPCSLLLGLNVGGFRNPLHHWTVPWPDLPACLRQTHDPRSMDAQFCADSPRVQEGLGGLPCHCIRPDDGLRRDYTRDSPGSRTSWKGQNQPTIKILGGFFSIIILYLFFISFQYVQCGWGEWEAAASGETMGRRRKRKFSLKLGTLSRFAWVVKQVLGANDQWWTEL